jgi:hypothetical protein
MFEEKQWVMVPTILVNGEPTPAYYNFYCPFYINSNKAHGVTGIVIGIETYTDDGVFTTDMITSGIVPTAYPLGAGIALIRISSISFGTGLPALPWAAQAALVFASPKQPYFKVLQHPWPYGINPEYSNAPAPFQSSRLNATSLLLTNVTKVLNKEGTVLASRLVASVTGDATTPLMNYAGLGALNASNPVTRYFGALERGSYSFTAPDQESLSFVSPYSRMDDTKTPKTRDYAVLTPQGRFYNAHFLTDSDSTPGNLTSIAVACDAHYEFRTKSTLFQLDYSRMPLELYHAASLTVMKAGLFYENEWHKMMINGVIKAAKWAAPVLANAYAGPTASLVRGAADLAAKKIESKIRQAPAVQKKPKATHTPSRKVGVKRTKVKGSMKQKGLR